MARKKKQKKSWKQELAEWVKALISMGLLVLAVTTFAVTPMPVQQSSMNDTLQDGDVTLVLKTDYTSVWFCWPWAGDAEKEACPKWTLFGEPSRYDVVITHYPGRGDTNFVKRVIGLPGDTLWMVDGQLYINGAAVEEPYVAEAYRHGYIDRFGPVTVPEGQYFLMGDHRNVSNDSRAVGCVPRDYIIGHVRSVLFPFSRFGKVE